MDSTRGSNLTAEERKTLIRGLAEGLRPMEIIDLVLEEHGREISFAAVRYYRDAEKWRDAIGAERDRLAERLAELPLSQAFIRQRMRADLITKHRDTSGALGAVRGLLLDAAKESGDLKEDAGTSAVQLTVQLVQQVLNLPAGALTRYVETGDLDPTAYLPDVLAARKLAELPPAEEPRIPARVMAALTGPGSSTPGLR